MFAINHAATALLLKKKFPTVSMLWLLFSVQAMELLWVALNFLWIERTTTEDTIAYVGDIHLSHMPLSHSVLTMTVAALAAWLLLSKVFKKPTIGLAVGIGIFSHLVLDLLTHSPDIPLAPGAESIRLGLGLYNHIPALAFLLEFGYGIYCWWAYKGGKLLLAGIVVFNLANITMFFPSLPGIEGLLVHQPILITAVIMVQIIITLAMVWYFTRQETAMAEPVLRR